MAFVNASRVGKSDTIPRFTVGTLFLKAKALSTHLTQITSGLNVPRVIYTG